MHTSILDQLRSLLAPQHLSSPSISPAVYDTAQLLFFLPQCATEATLAWLLAQQAADGGWGDPAALPLQRTPATLAALRALARHGHLPLPVQQRALAWLHATHGDWDLRAAHTLPVAAELLIPPLVADLQLPLATTPAYRQLAQLGTERQQRLQAQPALQRQAALHSWEAWGGHPHAFPLDALGSIGCSPAATAAWLAAHPDPAAQEQAWAYLQQAQVGCGAEVASVVPTVWPIDIFTRVYALEALTTVGVLAHPALAEGVAPLLADITRRLRTQGGVGFSSTFSLDADDTAAALITLLLNDQLPATVASVAGLAGFQTATHSATYLAEGQVSLITNARVLRAYRLAGVSCPQLRDWLLAQQQPSGAWLPDKWQTSAWYTTWLVLLGLGPEAPAPRERALAALLRAQRGDGSWAATEGAMRGCAEETAYALLALQTVERPWPTAVAQAIHAGQAWLRQQLPSSAPAQLWLGKERYRPHQVVQIYQLAALWASFP